LAFAPQPRVYNPYYEPPRRRFGTSPVEFFHLSAAMVLLAVVLWLVIERNEAFHRIRAMPPFARILAALFISFFGFALHELGHKFTAQHFGHWSEFRAHWLFLLIALLLAYFPPHLPIAAPGATWHTAQTRREQGKISAMGPIVNYLVAFIAFPFTFGSDTIVRQLAGIVVFFSTFLALFNLIPLGPLDGRKVFAWSWIVWLLLVGVGLVLMFQGIMSFVA
jgi:Zn-dependent protease